MRSRTFLIVAVGAYLALVVGAMAFTVWALFMSGA